MSSTSEISKYLDIDTNVVHNSVKDIQLSKDYIEEFGIGELDWKILEGSLHMNSCMTCLLYTSPSPRDRQKSRMPSSA